VHFNRDPAAPVPDLSPQLRAVLSLEVDDDPEGTREWFVIHHTNCGMETFTDEVMRGLLAQSLGTAISTGAVGVMPGRGRVGRRGIVDWLTIQDQLSSVVADCAAFGTIPCATGRPGLWVRLRRDNGPLGRGVGGD